MTTSTRPAAPAAVAAVNTLTDDAHNLEHLGEWDHGMEPDVVDASKSKREVRAGIAFPSTAVAASDDTHNLEHLGDWDHGVEPDVVDASSKSRDDKKKEQDASASKRRMAKQAQTAISNAVHNIGNVSEDTRNRVESHTEEEVAGMKLCVSNNVHQDSFEAPC